MQNDNFADDGPTPRAQEVIRAQEVSPRSKVMVYISRDTKASKHGLPTSPSLASSRSGATSPRPRSPKPSASNDIFSGNLSPWRQNVKTGLSVPVSPRGSLAKSSERHHSPKSSGSHSRHSVACRSQTSRRHRQLFWGCCSTSGPCNCTEIAERDEIYRDSLWTFPSPSPFP